MWNYGNMLKFLFIPHHDIVWDFPIVWISLMRLSIDVFTVHPESS